LVRPMARDKGGFWSRLGLGKGRGGPEAPERAPAARVGAARPREPAILPAPLPEKAPVGPGDGSGDEHVEFTEVPPLPPADVLPIPISLDGAPPDEEEVVSRAALEAEQKELRAEIAWLRGALGQQIAAKKRAEEEIRALADHDPLTGVASARRFADRLAVALIHAQRSRQKLAVVRLGLDNFAGTNERHGRTVGDDLLKSVALALETTLRQTDTIARMEGDEFAILLPGLKRDEDVGVVADKLRLSLRSPFTIGGHDLLVTASIGIALFPDDGPDQEGLTQSALVAMRRAKEKGGDTYDIHAPRTSALAAERLARERSLRRALVQGELALHYQPVVDCETGAIVGVEALLRWRNPERLVPAAEFVPLADVTGLAVPLGQWTLRHACVQARAWRDAGHEGLVVSVNVSARQLQHPALVKLVRRVLDEAGLPPDCLELEVPETELVRNPELSIERLSALKDLGLRLALDDFGTGDSVLSHLYRYPVDSLKIDGSVVRDMTSDRGHEAVARAGIALAKARRIKVVAEGVETEAQRILLASWFCDRMQGNLFGPPGTAADTERLLLRQRKTASALAAEEKPRPSRRKFPGGTSV